MIERKENVTIDDYINAILEDYKRTNKDMSIKEYSIDVRIYNSVDTDYIGKNYSVTSGCVQFEEYSSIAYCRVFIENCSVIRKEYYYLSFTKNNSNNYDFISNESIFMKFFNENDDVFWHPIG